ncbi:hypothetical protein M527_14055 [Sphingobium indicum IP26]|nr:hypothetical protein M527_14055 [Sphingobium indicum IP26]
MAKHQHYVPRLLLRGFLSQIGNEAAKKQVRVFDLTKPERGGFVVPIDNIMGEGRFNDWRIDDETVASIDPMADYIENDIAHIIHRIRDEKRIEQTDEVIADLSVFLAFQFIRTKKMRMMYERMNSQIKDHVAKFGFDTSRIKGLEDWDENKLKAQHAKHQISGLQKYAEIMSQKVYFAMTAPEGSSFYLSDHPVALHSDQERQGIMRGLGIGVPYIQIYLPLSAEVMLCAYDPAVLGDLMRGRDEEMNKGRSKALKALMDGKITSTQMRQFVEMEKEYDIVTPLIDAIRAGGPVAVEKEQVDTYNSLQVFHAHRFVVDPRGEFDIVPGILAERTEAASRHR